MHLSTMINPESLDLFTAVAELVILGGIGSLSRTMRKVAKLDGRVTHIEEYLDIEPAAAE